MFFSKAFLSSSSRFVVPHNFIYKILIPKDFIKNVREKDTIVYGSNVPYATYVEAGTSKQRARGFIKNGTKRIELRLFDDKRKAILLGETIRFFKEPELTESLEVTVTGLLRYDNFEKFILFLISLIY